MAILVTGCFGYIGAICSKILLEQGYDVVGIDNLSRSRQRAELEGLTFYQSCIQDDVIEEIVSKHKIDTVMHFAAFIEVAESVQKPELYYQNNYLKTKHFVDKLYELGVKQFIFSSTAAVYGAPINNEPLREDSELKPINPYGENKLAVEKYLQEKSASSDFKYIILRYFNVAGAYGELGEEHDPETHLIPIALDALLGQRQGFKIFGNDYDTPDGTAVRDYVHVVDLARAHIRALGLFQNKLGLNEAYNLGYKRGFSILEILNAIERVAGKSVAAEQADRRAGDPDALVADNSKALEIGLLQPEFDSIDKIIEDALAHRVKFHASKAKAL